MLIIAKVRCRAEAPIYNANSTSGIDEVLPKVTLHKPDVLVSSPRSAILFWRLKLTFAPVLRLDVDSR
jgi:hypothetical protein